MAWLTLGLAGATALSAGDFTFFVWSDSHFGAAEGHDQRLDCIDDMNRMPGKQYPPPLQGIVASPDFILHAGDMTEDGLITQWDNDTPSAADDYLSGRALLRFPVREILGNHDHRSDGLPDNVTRRFVAIYGARWYSFDHRGVHFVLLDSTTPAPLFSAEQLNWLRHDLQAVGRTRPIIPVVHFQPTDDAANNYAALSAELVGYNIPVILHGHEHRTMLTRWRGWDVWGTGNSKKPEGNPFATFTVVRIHEDHLRLISYNWWLNAWFTDIRLEKPITGLPPDTAAADFDRDGDVDQVDFGVFQACLSGSGFPQTNPACIEARLDGDEDVDQDDFGLFQGCMSGAHVPADPKCAG